MSSIRQLVITMGLVGSLTACESTLVQYEYGEYRPKERPLGYLGLVDENEQTTRIELHKIQRGYALKTPIAQDKTSRADFVVLKNKDYKYFSGIQFSWSF